MTQVTDKTPPVFLPEAVRKRPQDSAGHHAVVHPISPSAGRDGGLPSGGHLFPPAGHLLELHQSNVSQHPTFPVSFCLRPRARPHLFRVIIFYHTERVRPLFFSRSLFHLARQLGGGLNGLETPRSILLYERVHYVYPAAKLRVGGHGRNSFLCPVVET